MQWINFSRYADSEDRFFCGIVAVEICRIRSQGLLVFSAAEAWYEGVCLRRDGKPVGTKDIQEVTPGAESRRGDKRKVKPFAAVEDRFAWKTFSSIVGNQ
jgi:hypothetical protein